MKYYLYFFWLFLPAMLTAQNNDFVINGKIGNLNEPSTAYFLYKTGKDMEMDSCKLQNGHFTFRGTAEYPFMAQIVLNQNGINPPNSDADKLNFYVESGEMRIEGNSKISTAKVTGSKTNALYNEFHSTLNDIKRRAESIQITYMQAPEQLRNTLSFKDSLDREYARVMHDYEDIALSFVKNHPDDMLSLYMLRSNLEVNPDNVRAQEVYLSLSPQIKQSRPGIEVKEIIDKIKTISIGAYAPDFSIQDENGKQVKLSDFKGKNVVLFFWSPGCSHCKEEVPYLKQDYSRFKDKGLEIVGIAIESLEDKQEWLNAIRDYNMDWINVSELKLWQGDVTNLYSVKTVPYNLLIGSDGRVIAKELYRENRTRVLNEILGQQQPIKSK